MVVEHLVVVHLIDMVAREDNNVLGVISVYKADVLIDSVCCARIPVSAGSSLVRRQNVNAAVDTVKVPRLTVADVLVEHERLILCKHAYGIYARIYAV